MDSVFGPEAIGLEVILNFFEGNLSLEALLQDAPIPNSQVVELMLRRISLATRWMVHQGGNSIDFLLALKLARVSN